MELKPCPFCGGEAKLDDVDEYQRHHVMGRLARAVRCQAPPRPGRKWGCVVVWGEDEQDAIEKWNARRPAAVEQEVIASRADQLVMDSALWGHFLEVRKRLIHAWLAQSGHNPEEIARTLSMDPVQVRLIAATPPRDSDLLGDWARIRAASLRASATVAPPDERQEGE